MRPIRSHTENKPSEPYAESLGDVSGRVVVDVGSTLPTILQQSRAMTSSGQSRSYHSLTPVMIEDTGFETRVSAQPQQARAHTVSTSECRQDLAHTGGSVAGGVRWTSAPWRCWR